MDYTDNTANPILLHKNKLNESVEVENLGVNGDLMWATQVFNAQRSGGHRYVNFTPISSYKYLDYLSKEKQR